MYTITVLMSTYNGEKYLKTQIDSILAQKNVTVRLLVRDDGSSDNTIAILKQYAHEGKLEWYKGDNLKSAKSFMDLIAKSKESNFYAFCDQDDYWLPDKLSSAIKVLEEVDENIPALYYGKTKLVDAELKPIKQNMENREFTKFNEAVVSSNATGCTMCFNKKLRDIINDFSPEYQIMHDGWIHKVCLALDGYVYYDKNPYILYRQHGENVIGGTSTPLKRLKRRYSTIINNPCSRSRAIQEILRGYEQYLSNENLEICRQIVTYKKNIINRIKLVKNKKIYSSNKRIDTMYRLAVLFGVF